jgi:multiple sugar transport system substrate-binding protein
MRKGSPIVKILLVLALLVLTSSLAFAQAPSEVTVFYHAGAGVENDAIQDVFALFNESQDQFQAVLTELPGDNYNEAIVAAALAGNLACLIDIDGPNIANYVWAGYLQPLTGLLDEETLADVLPVNLEQGTINGELYAVGQFEGGLGIWGNRSLLEAAGVRIPEGIEDAWTLDEYNAALEALSQVEGIEYPLDMKMNYGAGEWFTFGFSPIVQGFGGDLIDRSTYLTAEGVLNGPESVAAMEWFQSLFENGYVNATPADDNDFINGKSALSYVGHWEYTRYLEALGDDLILLPVPNYGERAVTGTGSWAWGISSSCDNVEGAAALIDFMLTPDAIQTLTNANGAIPSRLSVLDSDADFAQGGPLHVYASQLANGVGIPRPLTPGYPVITQAFARAVDAIARGGDVQTALDEAVDAIEADIEANNGYGFGG